MARRFTPEEVHELMDLLQRCNKEHFEKASSAGSAAYYRVGCEVPPPEEELVSEV
jgi:hypothetical protein